MNKIEEAIKLIEKAARRLHASEHGTTLEVQFAKEAIRAEAKGLRRFLKELEQKKGN